MCDCDLLEGNTIELTEPDEESGAHQHYNAAITEPTYPGADWIETWLAKDHGDDSRSVLWNTDEAREFALDLIARCDLLDNHRKACASKENQDV